MCIGDLFVDNFNVRFGYRLVKPILNIVRVIEIRIYHN